MQILKELTTVTPLSKMVALLVFITLPIAAFLFGMQYQLILTEQTLPLPIVPIAVSPTAEPVGCMAEARMCPDGSVVGRSGPNCEFAACPTTTKGTAQNYACPEKEYVDCMPGIGGPDSAECDVQFLEWAKANCPGFKGGAF